MYTIPQPDFFDEDGTWHRAVLVDDSRVRISITRDGRLKCFDARRQLCSNTIHKVLRRMVVEIPLPPLNLMNAPARTNASRPQIAPIIHLSSPSLFEAVAKAVIRQVVRADHAKRVLHKFVARFGDQVSGDPSMKLFPTPVEIMQTHISELREVGLGFKSQIMHHVAAAFLTRPLEEHVIAAANGDAIELLSTIDGIGDWSARIALCDFRGDWSVYPFGDLAIRTWAPRLCPKQTWPSLPHEFEAAWRETYRENAGLMACWLLATANKQRALRV